MWLKHSSTITMYQQPEIRTFNSTLRKLLTADGDFSWSLHRSTITIVSIAGNLVHVSGNIVDNSDHVSSCLLAHQSSWYVQWDCRHWRSHGNAQDGHAAAFHYQIDGVDCGRLKHSYFSLTHWNTNLIRKKWFKGRFITYNSIQTMYDIPFDRLFLQLSNGIRHVMPSTDKARINSIGLDGSASHRRLCVPMC